MHRAKGKGKKAEKKAVEQKGVELKKDTAKMSMREQAAQVLEREAKYSYVGVTEDLHRFDTIAPLDVSRDGTIPVLRLVNLPHGFARMSAGSALTRLEALHQLIVGPSGDVKVKKLLGKSIVMAGGAVSRAIWSCADTNREPRYDHWREGETVPDIDLFLVGLSEAEANHQINLIAENLKTVYGELFEYRTERCITFRLPRGFEYVNDPITRTIQIVLRLYNTVSEIVHGFDLGSSAVAYYRGDIVMSSKGRFAFERGANILDLSRRRASYETRIVKYAERGFDIVLPDLDVEKVHGKGAILLPRLQFELASLTATGNTIDVIRLYAIHPPSLTEDIETIGRETGSIVNHIDVWDSVSESKHAVDLGALFPNDSDKKGAEEMECLIAGPIAGVKNVLGIIYAYLVEDELLPEEEGCYKSEYESGDNLYRIGRITWNNLRHAQRAVVKTASLCLFARFGKKSKIGDACTAGAPFIGLGRILGHWCQGNAVQLRSLTTLLGRDVAMRIAGMIADGTFPGPDALAAALTERYAPRAAIPFRFMRVEETTCLAGGGVLRMALMSPAEWYGDYLAAK
ncbi:MAG: hypothetical protein KGL39_21000 [Patescibacteria group bacterium]|nr:hypothetical protein [Patescibacteria group bacterium]